jgi:hypothetical protein
MKIAVCPRQSAERVLRSAGGFKTEAEAQEWIDHKSAAWLKEFDGGKYA